MSLRKVVACYSDLIKDVILLLFIVFLVGYRGLLSAEVTLFQNVVIWMLIATIVVPLFVSACQTSARHPLAVFEFSVWRSFIVAGKQPGKCKLAFLQLLVFSFYLFVPSILINNQEKAIKKRQILEEQGKEEYNSKEGIMTNKILEEQEQIEGSSHLPED